MLDASFGPAWRDQLELQRTPIGSGCIAQVYRGRVRVGSAEGGNSATSAAESDAPSASGGVAARADGDGAAGAPVAAGSCGSVSAGAGASTFTSANVKGPKQERNVHALTVLRRIKCKLDGKDRWPGRERETRQSVSEQVESVIKQACSPENLSMMYEGWCAWV